LALAQTPPPGPKASEAVVNPSPGEVIVSNAKATGTSARPEDIPGAPAGTGISVESPSASATPSPAIALATAAPVPVPAIAATPDVSVVTAPVVASTPEASAPEPEPAATIAAPTAAPELATATTATQPVIESAESAAPESSAAPVSAVPDATTTTNATPATALASETVGKFTPVPTVGERISSLAGEKPLLVWVLGLSGFGLLVSVVVMEIRRRIGTTELGHRPATVTGPSLHDDEVAEETPELQAPKRFIGGPRQVSVQLKASEPALRRAVIPVAKRAPDPIIVPLSEPEEATINGRVSEPAYVDFEQSSVGPVIEQVSTNGETEIAPGVAAFASPSYDEPAVSYEPPVSNEPFLYDEPPVSYEPAVQQVEPEPVAALSEETLPTDAVREWEVSEPVEAPSSVLETQVCEPATAEVVHRWPADLGAVGAAGAHRRGDGATRADRGFAAAAAQHRLDVRVPRAVQCRRVGGGQLVHR